MRKLYYYLALCVSSTVASAATLTLEVAPIQAYQQTTNSPCIIGAPSCGPKPLLFDPIPYTRLPEGNGTSYDEESPLYTVANIRSIVGNNFFVGADFNQTNDPQWIDLFTMFINGNLIDSYSVNPATSVPTISNGTGYADYLFKGFTSLASYNATDTVQFHVRMPVRNDGGEQFFLIANRAAETVTPEPSTYALMGAGLVALGVLRLRRRQ